MIFNMHEMYFATKDDKIAKVFKHKDIINTQLLYNLFQNTNRKHKSTSQTMTSSFTLLGTNDTSLELDFLLLPDYSCKRMKNAFL